MALSEQPARGRRIQFLFVIVHYIKFFFPILIGGLAFCGLTYEGDVR
ncbi:MAG: hypothetical protein JEZ00_17215 [Anaerolineaceae bacterium]|nr:hypothetical protein [Anaerolineaceae bacterium]